MKYAPPGVVKISGKSPGTSITANEAHSSLIRSKK